MNEIKELLAVVSPHLAVLDGIPLWVFLIVASLTALFFLTYLIGSGTKTPGAPVVMLRSLDLKAILDGLLCGTALFECGENGLSYGSISTKLGVQSTQPGGA